MSFSEELKELMDQLGQAAEQVVPHFFRTMPRAYFRENDRASRGSHLKAVIAAQATGLSGELILRNREGTRFTFINRTSYPGQLAEMIRQLPAELPLRSASIHTAQDGSLIVDIFELGETAPFDPDDPEQRHRADRIAELTTTLPLSDLLPLCASHYLATTSPRQVVRHLELVQKLRGTGRGVVESTRVDEELSEITIGVDNAACRAMFGRVARHLGHRGIDIQRARLATFGDEVSVLWFLVAGEWEPVLPDLARLNFLDSTTLWLAYDLGWALEDAEVLLTLARLAHQALAERSFTRRRVLEAARSRPDFSRGLVRAFRKEAPTPAADGEILECLAGLVDRLEATNLSCPERRALALRLSDGCVFVHGRGFDGLAFGEVSQVQALRPHDLEEYLLELGRLRQEAQEAPTLVVDPEWEVGGWEAMFLESVSQLSGG